jgi:hypothetical protein
MTTETASPIEQPAGGVTRKLQNLAPQWRPGESGNPAGRPKGARSKLGEKFLAGMLQAYEEGGIEAIRKVRDEEPAKFVSALVAILPRQMELDGEIKVRAVSAADQLVAKLQTLTEREAAYEADREEAVKTIEHEPSPIDRLFKKVELTKANQA